MWLVWMLFGQAVFARTPGGDAEDESALARIARGDGGGLAGLYDRHARPVYSLALRILGSQAEAEDIVQEVFAQAWRQAGRYDASKGRVAGWLLVLTRSRAIDRLRTLRSRKVDAAEDRGIDFDAIPNAAMSPDVQVIAADQQVRVRRAVDQLAPGQRLVLEMAFYEGLTHVEIAERLEEPLGTVKTRIRNGLMKLRDLVGANVS